MQKPGSLDDYEYEIVKLHPQRGRELLNELGSFDDSIERLVLDHHERLDGSGYPRGLHAEDLALETRILAVCDVYDALVSPIELGVYTFAALTDGFVRPEQRLRK